MANPTMNPAYYLQSEPAPIRRSSHATTNTSTTRRSSTDSDYSLVKPMPEGMCLGAASIIETNGHLVKPKNKTFLGIFVKNEKPSQKQSKAIGKAKRTTMYDIAHGSTAHK